MIDHLGIAVRDYAHSKAFYTKALAPLGLTLIAEFGQAGGFGEKRPYFWISGPDDGKDTPTGRVHLAFNALDRAAVDAFYAAAIAAGGVDNGPPGVRAHYHPNYYGAFVLDPDGHNVEAVCHTPG